MLAVNLFAVCIGAFDYFFNTDYMYLRAKPINASLLDVLGPWPWYILSLEAMALLSYLVYYSPFFIMDLIKQRRARAVV